MHLPPLMYIHTHRMSTLYRKQPVLPSGASVENYARATHEGVFGLLEGEKAWQSRFRYLEEHGHVLRQRSTPGWKPSWMGTNLDPMYCEDSIVLLHSQDIDVSILEILSDPCDPQQVLLVMPFLRPCNDPEFATVGDVIEFLDQTIEGLVVLHQHNVAHRDIAAENLMMDARALLPNRTSSSPAMADAGRARSRITATTSRPQDMVPLCRLWLVFALPSRCFHTCSGRRWASVRTRALRAGPVRRIQGRYLRARRYVFPGD
ncbi:hypothetical protein C8Q77DRAFT_296822 [Trametes polyzona]|nr:hypothetical protein C8Q77DRAFT_296822 [Trametes polyzona]